MREVCDDHGATRCAICDEINCLSRELDKYKQAYEKLKVAMEKIENRHFDDKTHIRFIEDLKKWKSFVLNIKSQALKECEEIMGEK